MKTGYQLRGQGIGVVFDKTYENYPPQADFDAAMTRELESHGFDPETGEPRPRWVRVQEIKIDDGKCSESDVCKAKLHEQVEATLTQKRVEEIRAPHPGRGGSAVSGNIGASGQATVSPEKGESQTITSDDVGTLVIAKK